MGRARCQREVVEHDLRESGLDILARVVERHHRDADATQRGVHRHGCIVGFKYTLDGNDMGGPVPSMECPRTSVLRRRANDAGVPRKIGRSLRATALREVGGRSDGDAP